MPRTDLEGFQEGELLAEVRRSDREAYRVSLCSFKGTQYVDVRIWYRDSEAGEFRPAKGVTIRPAALSDVIAALQRGQELLEGGRE